MRPESWCPNHGASHPGAGAEELVPATLKELVVEALIAAGDEGIAPQMEGRICNTLAPVPCLALGE